MGLTGIQEYRQFWGDDVSIRNGEEPLLNELYTESHSQDIAQTLKSRQYSSYTQEVKAK